jgi:hypothetical protein
MLVLSLSLGAIVATPTTAHAAGSYFGAQFSMNGFFPTPSCFCSSDVAGATAKVWWSLDGRSWYFVGYFPLNEAGRVGFDMPGLEYLYFAIMVDHQMASARFMSPVVYFHPYERSPFPKQALVTRY